jgi:uncharacterized SAM-binding protein YcdF (DUF218 family)
MMEPADEKETLPTIFHCGPLEEDGSFSESMRARVERTIELYKKGAAKPLIFNTSAAYRTRTSESGWEELLYIDTLKDYSKTIRDYLLGQGVKEEDINANEWAQDTVAEIFYIIEKVLKPDNIRKVRVITNEYHMERCLEIYRKAAGERIEIVPEAVRTRMDVDPENRRKAAERERASLRIFQEQFGTVTPGDSQAFEKALYTNHKLYKDLPEEKRMRFHPL